MTGSRKAEGSHCKLLISEILTLKLHFFLSAGLSLAVAAGTEEVDLSRGARDSKPVSVNVSSDRTADRRSKGVINLLFKSKVDELVIVFETVR